MPDYTLVSPDGDVFVTGDGSERARLVASGYREKDSREPSTPEPPKSEPKPDNTSKTKTEFRNDSK